MKSYFRVLTLVVVAGVVMLHNNMSYFLTMNKSTSGITSFGLSLSIKTRSIRLSSKPAPHFRRIENGEVEGKSEEERRRRSTRFNDRSEMIINGTDSSLNYSEIRAERSRPIGTRKLVLPNVLLIGAQKAGTSAVADWLYHNGVCKAKIFDGEPSHYEKEVHFFYEHLRYQEGVEFYSKRFEHCVGRKRKKYILDATPKYLLFSKRIYDLYNESSRAGLKKSLKLMVVLREPISREISWYNHRIFRLALLNSTGHGSIHESYRDILQSNGAIMSFDQYSETVLKDSIKVDPSNSPGIYVEHLKSWVKLFDRKQLLVLSYDELQSNPAKTRWRINKFLGTKYKGGFNKANTKESDSKIREVSLRAGQALKPLFQETNEKLYAFLRDHPGPAMEQKPFPHFE
ncbi:hypothetical protein ACHAW6_004348 [Cyclotella cf. meneghiniana]